MRTIAGSFNQIRKQNPYWADYVCLVEAVRGREFTRRRLYENFIKLVSPDDYNPKDTNRLIAYLHKVTKEPVECTFLTEIDLEQAPIAIDDPFITFNELHTI